MGREALLNAIRSIALDPIVDKNGRVLDASIVSGYVVKVHEDEGDELVGTVDVQEYNVESTDIEDQGLHEGVLLTAIQNFSGNVFVIPRLYSDVTIAKDSVSGVEYVESYSLIDKIHYESGQTVELGVKEREEYDPNGSEDIEDKAYTGNEAWTEYSAKDIKTVVVDEGGDEVSHLTTSKDVTVKVGDDVEIKAEQDKISVKVSETTIVIEGDKVTIKTTDVKVEASGDANIEAKGDVNVKATGAVNIKGSTSCEINTPSGKITGGMLEIGGVAAPSGMGGFCSVPVCPITGAVHIGDKLVGT